MKIQLKLDYNGNYTDTSKSAWANKKDKLTKREQVYEYVKTQASTNYEISDERKCHYQVFVQDAENTASWIDRR